MQQPAYNYVSLHIKTQKMKKHILIFLLGVWFVGGFSQSYNTAAGLRFGSGVGMSVKQRIFEKTTVEGIAQTQLANRDFTTVTTLVQRHYHLKGRAINGYMGVGGHRTWHKNSQDFYGFDGILGIEGTLFNLNTSIDYKPALSYINENYSYRGQLGVSVRYVIIYAPHGKKSKKSTVDPTNPPLKPSWL